MYINTRRKKEDDIFLSHICHILIYTYKRRYEWIHLFQFVCENNIKGTI